MARIRMSESELLELGKNVQTQQNNIQDVSAAGNAAVSAADADWQSAAFDTFKERWSRDRGLLEQLASELADWNRKLNQHAGVAREVNRPFA